MTAQRDSIGKGVGTLPSQTKSEEMMAPDGPDAVRYLRRKDALDLLLMLNLGSYLSEV